MNKRRQRRLKASFQRKFGHAPAKATAEQPSEWRTLKSLWRAYQHGAKA